MSRTYRRTEKGQRRSWLPNIHRWDVEEGHYRWWRNWSPDPWVVAWLEKNPHRRSDVGDYYHWLSCEPSWWHRLFSTRPRRHKERALCRKIVKGEVDEEEAIFPLHCKPHRYYW